jgi:hypothetical protein
MPGEPYFCRAVTGQSGNRVALLGVGVAFAAASLLRPTDALAAAAPLLLAALVVGRWRRIQPLAWTVAGLAVGWGAWVIEAYARFGGPVARFSEASRINESGLTWSLPQHLDAVPGPYLLCRPHDVCTGGPLSTVLWWLLLPFLVALGLFAARRVGALPATALAGACGLAAAGSYILLIDYAAPRFLLPTYGLLSIPVALGVLWVATVTGRRTMWASFVAVSTALSLLTAHVFVQQRLLHEAHEIVARRGDAHEAHAAYLRAMHGVGAVPDSRRGSDPGRLPAPLPLPACDRGHDRAPRVRDPRRSRPWDDVVVRLKASSDLPAFMADWRRVALPGTETYVAYLPPAG